MNQIHNWLNTGLIVIVGVLVLVGGNQSAPLRELGRVGTEFQHGLRTRWLETPDTETSNTTSFSTTRRCPIASGQSVCQIQNLSSVVWLMKSRILSGDIATPTRMLIAVSTSSAALGTTDATDSWTGGYATSTLIKKPLKISYSSTTPDGIATSQLVEATTTVGHYIEGLFPLFPGEYVDCVAVRTKHPGRQNEFDTATGTNFAYQPTCFYEIVATSTPDNTPTR